MAKFLAKVHLVHKGAVVRPGDELDLTKAQSDKLKERSFIEDIPKADNKKQDDKKADDKGGADE